jgi:hypothetical protein
MSDTQSESGAEGRERPPAEPPKKSFGNMSEHHWSRARARENQEALEYYRRRSHAPGVAEGGAERNYYCMKCDGVIPFDFRGPGCPHCSEPLEGAAKRYFNWVEINEPAESDFKALLPFLLVGLVILALVLVFVLRRFH